MASQNTLCVGIDLGTTNSLIATCRYANGKIITPVKKVARAVDGKGVKRNDELLPSFVYYPQNAAGGDAAPIVGDFAKAQYVSVPYRVAKSIKSQMGNPNVTGLQDGIPDKSPEEVSSRIIRHLIGDLEKHYAEEIKDVVITVPASFDPAQRLATLRAAELAGVDVRNDDGTYNQDILLSEPEAVMYNILNQIKNGEYDANLSFDTAKKVLVFDIGGGTLDITLHSIKKNAENPEILDMDLIATNRFTPVAGDTFDRCVAEAMYKQYVETYRSQLSEAAKRIEEKKDMLFPSLQAYAETLKVDINSRYDDAVYRHKLLSDETEFECGGVMPNGYPYDGYFTKRDYENSVRNLLGYNYSYEDYKTIEGKPQTQDIIWPVLDVLRKGAKKSGVSDIRIDAVIMSGGMSRLYLIKNRLEEFFGFHVISVPDPDQAVAQGAVVYHFHQHQDSELMKRLHAKEQPELVEKRQYVGSPVAAAREIHDEIIKGTFIHQGKSILADPIFLGLKGGANKQLADEGQELPYRSEAITGFRVEKDQDIVCVPIQKRGNSPKEFVTIASGIIRFQKKPREDTPVAIRFEINKNQIITIEAWTYKESNNLNPIEKGIVSFSFNDERTFGPKATTKSKIVPPAGSRLVPHNEISALVDLCKKNGAPNSIKLRKTTISSCGNPDEFDEPILKALENNNNNLGIAFNLIPLARRLSRYWPDNQKSRLVRICFVTLEPELRSLSLRGSNWNSVYNEAILTIGMLGSNNDVNKLYTPTLTNKPVHGNALIHAFSYHGMHVDWVADHFLRGEVEAYRWIGLAISRASVVDARIKVDRIVDKLIAALDRMYENPNLVTNAVISLGMLCDRRLASGNKADSETCDKAENAIVNLNNQYPEEYLRHCTKPMGLALKLIRGQELNMVEEGYLLSLYED